MPFRARRAALLAAASLSLMLVTARAHAASAEPEGDPWQRGATWMTVKFGGVKAMSDNAPDGNVGWGIAYRKFLTSRLSLGAGFDQDLVGRYGAASLIEVPLSLELALNFNWKTGVHPAIGAGFAAVYRKAYRTGDDFSELQPAGFVSVALHAPINSNTVIGADFRAMSVSSDQTGGNPVFDTSAPSSGRLTLKVALSRAFW